MNEADASRSDATAASGAPRGSRTAGAGSSPTAPYGRNVYYVVWGIRDFIFFSTYTFQENTPCLTDRPVAFLAARLADYRPVGRPVTAHIALVRTVARRNALRNAATIEES